MSRRETACGSIFILGYQGLSPSPEFIDLIKRYQVGGIIFFERNIVSPSQLKDQIAEFQALTDYPLLFVIDQEGGKVNRIKTDFPVFPSNNFYGEREDLLGAQKAYQITAAELRSLGMNVNLAPVVDVTRGQENFMADRSFGSDPNSVSEFTRLAVEAVHSEQVLACAKHFPGIGGLKDDPHQTLPVNNQPADEFWSRDFLPFQAAIETGVKMVMTTHVKCSSLDQNEPATFSGKITTDILRKKLKFEGLIVTDDMEMGGVKDYLEPGLACRKAFLAGHDLILLCHSPDLQKRVLESFGQKAKTGEIPKDRLQQSLDRIRQFKDKLG
jgi:beta-N-acetylhexosaminidase